MNKQKCGFDPRQNGLYHLSRTITSPVKRFEGTVVLADPLTFDQVFAFQDAMDAARAAGENYLKVNHAVLPGVLACVEAWHLANIPEGVTLETFPATPPVAVARLIAWLVEELSKEFEDAETIPNG